MRWWRRETTQACTVQYPERVDELATPVIVSEAYDPTVDMPRPALERFNRAIWDTGATGSVISERVVERLGLYPISQRDISTANGTRTAGVYLIALYLLNNVVFPSLPVTDGNLGNDVDVLIGMDVIGSGDFAVGCGSSA